MFFLNKYSEDNITYSIVQRRSAKNLRMSRFFSPSGFRMTKVITACLIFLILSCVCHAENRSGWTFQKGETITYDIKKFRLNVGEATLVYDGLVDLKGQEALLVTVTAKGFRFYDEEKIYLDPQTFYPLMIERDLDIFGIKEQISEFYDTERGKVRIVKTKKGKKSEQIIANGNRFDNIYGFIYRYRNRGQFRKGEEFHLHLPMRDVTFRLDDKSRIKAAGQEYEAYYMNSVPKKYKVWFDDSHKKIPLKIDGVIGFGRTSMVLKEYAENSGS